MLPLRPQLIQRFIEGRFAPVDYRGKLVFPDYRVDLEEGESLGIEWLSSNTHRAQAVVLRLVIPGRSGRKSEGGSLQWHESSGPSLRLWERSAGPIAHVRCVKRRADARVVVTNACEGPTGVSDGAGNFGMLVEPEDEDAVVLRCSNGLDEWPDFRNMVVRLSVVRTS